MFHDVTRKRHMEYIMRGRRGYSVSYLRIDKGPFLHLASILRDKDLLVDTWHVPIKEQLAIFLHIVDHIKNKTMRVEFLQSSETICPYFNNVLQAICVIHNDFIHPPSATCHRKIETNPNWWCLFFKVSIWLINSINFREFLKSLVSISHYLCFNVGLCRFIRWDPYWCVCPCSWNTTVMWPKGPSPKYPCCGEPYFAIYLRVGG